MKFKEFFKNKVLEMLKQIAMAAVVYAENAIGEGNGEKKKQIAIDFILSKLPVCLKPFVPLFKKILNELMDMAIEYAVEKLHNLQETKNLK